MKVKASSGSAERLPLFDRRVSARPGKSHPLAQARTCYDHLAGQLGVALFDSLVARGALVAPAAPGERVELGPAARELFGDLGIDLGTPRRGRRPLATACLDWTERRPHLAGALGAALCARLVELGWVSRQPGSRAVAVGESGRRSLRQYLDLQLPEADS